MVHLILELVALVVVVLVLVTLLMELLEAQTLVLVVVVHSQACQLVLVVLELLFSDMTQRRFKEIM